MCMPRQCFYYYLFTHCGYNASNTFAPLQLYIAPVVALVLYLCVGAVGLFYTAPGITKSPGSSGTPSVVSAATLTSGSSASSPTASAQTRMVSGRIVAPGRTAGIVLLTVYGLAAATLWAPAVFGPTVYGGVAQWHHEHVSPRPRTGAWACLEVSPVWAWLKHGMWCLGWSVCWAVCVDECRQTSVQAIALRAGQGSQMGGAI